MVDSYESCHIRIYVKTKKISIADAIIKIKKKVERVKRATWII
tara:strand:+ start:358 stop:486 length:129 start_codon:yes stop_codon:yes gene_type:complete